MDRASVYRDLKRLAANYRWSWTPSSRRLLASLPGGSELQHPALTVAFLIEDDLVRLTGDDVFIARLQAEVADLDALTADAPEPRIAYFSPEYALSARLRQYSGGLGVLAGDHLKAAGDAGIPLVGVGLLYRRGFFRQMLIDGEQSEMYFPMEPLEVGAIDTGYVVSVPFPGRDVLARLWRIDVGRTPLILLDTDMDGNELEDRQITDRLYAGDRRHRLEQELVLGVGGARALAALGWNIELYHLNEGHAGFAFLELVNRRVNGDDFDTAIKQVRSMLMFTTHTPVPAGIDRFEGPLVGAYVDRWAEDWGASPDVIWDLGRDPDDPHMFNMAALCLNVSAAANGVSKLHGETAKAMFRGVGIGDDITSVTNGVHARTWTGRWTQHVYDEAAGPGWADGDPEAWEKLASMDEEALRGLRRGGSERLARVVADVAGHKLDPDALIIGFARRFAPYKRATLVLRHRDRLRELLASDDRPVHFIFGGTAHPRDDPGKRLLAEIVGFGLSPESNGRFTFLPGYDMEMALMMFGGCDVWLNTPVRPREASGTSGEKAVLNGGVNASILDGWWAEMYDGDNGWAIAASDRTGEGRDDDDAASALDVIAEAAAEYHDRPGEFLSRVRRSMRTLGPQVTAARMLRDYDERLYSPLLASAGPDETSAT